jgi:hypothetical protein
LIPDLTPFLSLSLSLSLSPLLSSATESRSPERSKMAAVYRIKGTRKLPSSKNGNKLATRKIKDGGSLYGDRKQRENGQRKERMRDK